jgi:hypothetical protein
MAKAEEAYHKRDLYSDGAVITLARYHARETIKRELKAQGIKLASGESCEITRANRYIDDHPEIIAFAAEEYRSLVASGQLRPQGEICTTEEALSCKDFRCANIVTK